MKERDGLLIVVSIYVIAACFGWFVQQNDRLREKSAQQGAATTRAYEKMESTIKAAKW